MIELTELEDLCELKTLIKEHATDCDYPKIYRILEKIEKIENKKRLQIQERNRILEYSLDSCEHANKMHLEEIKKIRAEND